MCYNVCKDSFNGIFDSRKRGKTMAISYKKLWKLLIDKDMKKKDLQQLAGISSASITKLGKNENVNTEIIEKICVALQCDVSDIMEMTEDE
jgi:DNA-binding Xre family transcriptional regulator